MPETPDQVIQSNRSRILGYLVRFLGDFDNAEDIQQEVVIRGLENWRENGVPVNPLAWFFLTARNLAIDFQRRTARQKRLNDNEPHVSVKEESLELDSFLEDDLLRLIFTCCHPALNQDARVALTLRAIVGFTLDEAAKAFLVTSSAMEQRLVRAKRKIKAAGIAYQIPERSQMKVRLDSVLQTVYLIFNEGYYASSGTALISKRLCREAIRLGTLLNRLFRGHVECMGLLSLMLLQDSRSSARVSSDGGLVLLAQQDRSLWNQQKIQQGKLLLEKALLSRQKPGPYQIQAAIAALHAESKKPELTDWQQISDLYLALQRYVRTPVVRLNYAVSLMMLDDLEEAEKHLIDIRDSLKNYNPYYCAVADLQLRKNNLASALDNLERAIELSKNDTEIKFLKQKAEQVRSQLG